MALLPPMSTTSCKFESPGTVHSGKLIEIGEPQQATTYDPSGPGKLAFWDDEKTRPRMQRRFLLQCQPDPAIAGDDGRRALWATVSSKAGGMYAAINKAVESANALGGTLTVTFTGVDPESKNPQNPRKLYTASYVEPTLGEQMAQPAAETNTVAAPAAQAAAPAPAAVGLVKPDLFPQAVWDTLDDPARAAVLAAQ